jgi:hypothetical protein
LRQAVLAACLPLFAAVATLAGCRGDAERDALRAYEAAVEDLVGEDDRVRADLGDLRQELAHGNKGAGRLGPYVEGTAAPFYARFRKKVAGLAPAGERLGQVHARLLAYLGHMETFTASTASFEKARTGDALAAFESAHEAVNRTMTALQAIPPEQIPQEALDLFGLHRAFFEKRFEPFVRGQLPVSELRNDIDRAVLPPAAALAARTAADLEKQDLPGLVARWVAALHESARVLRERLGEIDGYYRAIRDAEAGWTSGEKERASFLSALKAYRESLR